MQETAGLTRSWFEIKEEVARVKKTRKKAGNGHPAAAVSRRAASSDGDGVEGLLEGSLLGGGAGASGVARGGDSGGRVGSVCRRAAD
jgi:hypothetical protein